MEALRYKLFPLYLGEMLRSQEANDEGIVYTRRITNLKPFSCFPERLREGHKNFDVYPRNKEKPILSAYTPERIKPLTVFPTSRICVRDFVSPTKADVQRAMRGLVHGLYEDF